MDIILCVCVKYTVLTQFCISKTQAFFLNHFTTHCQYNSIPDTMKHKAPLSSSEMLHPAQHDRPRAPRTSAGTQVCHRGKAEKYRAVKTLQHHVSDLVLPSQNTVQRKYLIRHQGGVILFGLACSKNSDRHQAKGSGHCHGQHHLNKEGQRKQTWNKS